MGYVRSARKTDASELAPILRDAEREEISALVSETPERALLLSIDCADEAYTICADDDTVIGLFGVSPTPKAGVGLVWMLGSDLLVQHHKIQFLRHCKGWVADMQSRWPVLWNIVHAKNELHLMWLKWLGFEFIRELTYGPKDEKFYEFIRT